LHWSVNEPCLLHSGAAALLQYRISL